MGKQERIPSFPQAIQLLPQPPTQTYICTHSHAHTSVFNYFSIKAEPACQRRDCLLVKEPGRCALQLCFSKKQEHWGLGDLQNSQGSVSTSREHRCWDDTWLFCKTGSFKMLWAQLCGEPPGLSFWNLPEASSIEISRRSLIPSRLCLSSFSTTGLPENTAQPPSVS